jgi:hypothetical protein
MKPFSSKILKSWNSYTNDRLLKQYQDQNKIELFQGKIQKHLIVKFFYSKWFEKTNKQIKAHGLNEKAQKHYNKNLKRKIFENFQMFRTQSKRKKQLEKQAEYFNRIRVEYCAFDQWSRAYQTRMSEKHVHNLAIRHWAWQLEKKCFLHWILYIKERKTKKERYSSAINDRQLNILKTSIQSLVAYAMDAKERRFKHNLQFKQQNILNMNQLAFKYFFTWKEKCLKKFDLKNKINSLTTKSECNKTTTPAVFTDTPSFCVTNRPQPRKPAFLFESLNNDSIRTIQSIQAHQTVQDIPASAVQVLVESNHVNCPTQTIGTDTVAEPKQFASFTIRHLYDSSIKPILMPPSAFTTVLVDSSNLNKFDSRSTSASTVMSGINDEFILSIKNQKSINENLEKDFDLLKIKQRMENLAAYKLKLK